MSNNGNSQKVKVGISVHLNDSGEVAIQATSQNKVVLIGLLEMAKQIVSQPEKQPEEESRIHRV